MNKLLGLVSANKTAIPLKGIDVKVNIVGTVAEVQSSLTYKNDEDSPIEASFTFPVDDGSAVYRFEAEIQGRKIVAEIQEREQAKRTYKDSLAEGRTAALLKQDDNAADVFQCMLGNMPAQAEATLVLAYVIELSQEADGKLRFTLPTILNPRYSPDAGCTVPMEGATYTTPSRIPYTFSFSADIRGYHKVSSVTSTNSTLKLEMRDNDHHAKVTLGEEFKFDRDLDLLVLYENCFKPQIAMEVGKPGAEGLFQQDLLMLSLRPDLKEVSMATSGEFIFVIDRSGSMDGDKIRNVKEALLLFLKSLPADCYFNIISFGSSFEALFSLGSKKYSEGTLKKAITLQQQMEANMGGTEILKPMEHAYHQQAIQGHPRSMFILTDGEVGNTDQIIGLVKKHAASVRVFALGVGHGASTSLVNGIARAGNGKAEFIADNSRVQPKVISLLKCAMQPAITNVELSWDLPPDVTTMLIPETPPMIVTAGERLTLYALMQGVDHNTTYGTSSITLKGILGSQPVSYSLPFTLNDETKSYSPTSAAHRLATKAQIKILEDEYNSNMTEYFRRRRRDDMDTLQNKIITLSRHGNLVCKMTAFVAVDTEGQKVEGAIVQRACPVPSIDKSLIQYGLSHGARRQTEICDIEQGRRKYMSSRMVIEACQPSPSPLPIPSDVVYLYDDGMAVDSYNCLEDEYEEIGDSPPPRRVEDGFEDEFEVGFELPDCLTPPTPPLLEYLGEDVYEEEVYDDAFVESASMCVASSLPPPLIPDEDAYIIEEEVYGDAYVESCVGSTLPPPPPPNRHSLPRSSHYYRRDALDVASTTPTQMDKDSRMMAVIAEQKIQGNWQLKEKLANLLQLTPDKIKGAISLQDKDVVCTLVVLTWLAKNFPQRREEWQIIESKATSWLLKQSLDIRRVHELLAQCRDTLEDDSKSRGVEILCPTRPTREIGRSDK